MHFCDSVWSFQWMRLAGVGFPYRLYIYILPLDIRYQGERIGIPLTVLTPPQFCVPIGDR